MPLYLYDEAFDSPGRTALIKSRPGAVAISHYLTGSHATTSPQVDAVRAAGLGALHNWERQPGALVGASRATGRNIAAEAVTGISPKAPRDWSLAVYFSVDVDVANSTPGVCDEGFRGVRDVLDPLKIRAAAYAEIGVIEHVVRAGILAGKHWLSMSPGFSPIGHYGASSPYACIVQMHDAAGNWIGTDVPGTDRNIITDPQATGIWWPDGSPYLAGDDMSAADVTAIEKAITDSEQRLHDTIVAETRNAAARVTASGADDATAAQLASAMKSLPAAQLSLTPDQLTALAAHLAGLGFTVTSTVTTK
jgi:hypothetical protein